ncbi:hypothetical protein IFM89_004955 [Coptis chinensis]|uniref:Uncharacterized protein n=1 Tax=Coptis chinensis TaxID=261450 RepID=A0A835HT95_9MAGN|nr:hypothetical protein IFM89_004955 [Coptis chinensis]
MEIGNPSNPNPGITLKQLQSPNDTQLDGETYYDPDAWRMPSDGEHDNAYNVVDDDNDNDIAMMMIIIMLKFAPLVLVEEVVVVVEMVVVRVGRWWWSSSGFDDDHARVRARWVQVEESQQPRVSIGGGVGSQRVTPKSQIEGGSSIAQPRGGSSTTIKGLDHGASSMTRISSKKRSTKESRSYRSTDSSNCFYGQGSSTGVEMSVDSLAGQFGGLFSYDQPYGYSSTGSNMVEYSTDSSYANPPEEYSRSQYYGNWNDPQAYSTTSTYATSSEQYASPQSYGDWNAPSREYSTESTFVLPSEQYAPPRHSYGGRNERDQSMEDVQSFSDHSVDMPPPAWGTVWEPPSRPVVEETGIRLLVTFNCVARTWINRMTCNGKTLRIGSAKPSLGTRL